MKNTKAAPLAPPSQTLCPAWAAVFEDARHWAARVRELRAQKTCDVPDEPIAAVPLKKTRRAPITKTPCQI